jgi:hypothetical protein
MHARVLRLPEASTYERTQMYHHDAHTHKNTSLSGVHTPVCTLMLCHNSSPIYCLVLLALDCLLASLLNPNAPFFFPTGSADSAPKGAARSATARLRRWLGGGSGAGSTVRPATSPTQPGLPVDHNEISPHSLPPPSVTRCPASAAAAAAVSAASAASTATATATSAHPQLDAPAPTEPLATRTSPAPASAAFTAAAGGVVGLARGKNQVLPFMQQ